MDSSKEKPSNIYIGLQSSATVLQEDVQGNSVVRKLFGSRIPFTLPEARELMSSTVVYRRELLDSGIKLPVNYDLRALGSGNEWRIVIVDQMLEEGQNVKQRLMLGEDLSDKEQIITKLFQFLNELPDGAAPYTTAVMGDFKPSNFVLHRNELILVDYFAPKRWLNNLVTPYLRKLDRMPASVITFLCGDRRGQVTRMLDALSISNPEMLSFACNVALEINSAHHPEIVDYLNDEISTGLQRMKLLYQMRAEFFDYDL